MVSATTNGITVHVTTFYRLDESAPHLNRFVFAYLISIENQSKRTFQLLSRHWYILNGIGETREVIGEGVVGQQPIIEPGFAFRYESFCLLATPLGRMWGTYTIQDPETKETWDIAIPEFTLESLTLQN
jgi:ApaG protein